MRKLTGILFVAVLSVCSAFAAGVRPKLEPAAAIFDFESGSVGSWSSYPPAQDTAYDPTIWVKQVEGNASKALLREITPNYEIEYRFGMRKKLNLYVDAQSTLSFRYYLKSYRPAEAVIVKLAFGDRTSNEVNIPVKAVLQWDEARVAFQGLVKSGEPVKLEAVALMALIPKADPEALLRFAVDDVTVNGFKEVEFTVEEPDNYRLEEFNTLIAKRHYREGDVITIRGEFPSLVSKASIAVERALTGDKKKAFDLRKDKNTWTAAIPSAGLGAGIWRAAVRGVEATGKEIVTGLVFLVKPKGAVSRHPRLLISDKDKARILENMKAGRPKEIWEKLKGGADNIRKKLKTEEFNYNLDAYDEIYWLPTYSGYAGTIRSLAGYARANGLVYLLSGDKEAGEAAKKALLKMSEWPTYVHPHILNQGQFTYWPVGLILLDLALGYDWVYDLLSPEEKRKVADSLYHKGVTEVFKEYVRDNRVSSNTSNWISHVTGGGILCALAISGEYGDADIEPYLTGMILKVNELVLNTYDRDGNYGEGYGYHNFTTETLSEIMPVLESNFGIEFPKEVLNSYMYLLYQMDFKNKEIYDFGDTGTHLGSMSNFAYLLKKTKDPLLKWLYDLAPGDHDVDLLFHESGIKPQDPSGLPKVKLFRDVGTAVFRSGFNHEDFAFVFRCGPFYNHQHFDQGSFFLVDKGEDFILEGSKTDYYNDPWYQKFFIQPGAHNCILADRNVESQIAGDLPKDVSAWQDYAKITQFLEFPEGAFAAGDLTKIYKKKFKSLSRNILYLAPRTIVLIDQAEGETGTKRMDLRFHPPLKKDVRVKGNVVEVKRPAASLFIKTVAPERFACEVAKRPLSLAEFGAENSITMSARGFIRMSADLSPSGTTFVNVFSTDENVISGTTSKGGDGFIELSTGGKTFYINKTASSYGVNGIQTDALIFSRTPKGYLALKATKISGGGSISFEADLPVSISVERGKTLFAICCASQKTRIFLSADQKPGRVLLNGAILKSWAFKNKLIGFEIPEGSNKVEIY